MSVEILYITVLVATIWVSLGMFVLALDEIAAVDVLGNDWGVYGPGGLHWRPWGISRLHRAPTQQQKIEIELPPVTMGSTKNSLYFNDALEPVRFHDLSPETQREIVDDPLHHQFTIRIKTVVFFQLTKEGLFPLIRRVKDIPGLKDDLADTTRAVLHSKLGRITAGTLLAYREVVSALYGEKLKEVTAEWGFPILLAQIGEMELPLEIETANRDAAKSHAEKHVMITHGEGRAGAIQPMKELMRTEEGRSAAILVESSNVLQTGKVDVILAPELMGALAGMKKMLQM